MPPRPDSVSIIIMTTPSRPERYPLLQRTVHAALHQRVSADLALEVLVLDDGPASGAAAHIAPLAADAPHNVRLRYALVPPDPTTGLVNMRLKRNLGLELCTGSAACFFDDDDWRSADTVQAQLGRMIAADADVCTLQVEYVCELDAAARAARYFYLAGGGGLFSARLGNPGTMLLRRTAWERNAGLGFPDTPAEDVDYVRLLTASTPLLTPHRPHRCTHTLLDAAAAAAAAAGVGGYRA